MTRTTGGATKKKPTPPHHGKTAGAKHDRHRAASKRANAAAKNQRQPTAEDTRLVVSKEYIQTLPVRHWDGKVKLLLTKDEMQNAVREILPSHDGCLGFDIESKPTFRKGQFHPPALLQIATADTVYLFRLCKLHGNRKPNSNKPDKTSQATFAFLLPLLADPKILKAGVGVSLDAKNLQSLATFRPRGFCELGNLVKKSIRSLSLQALAAHFVKCHVPKSRLVTMSDWTQQPLSDSQIKYAATDAWLGRAIWKAMQQENEAERGIATLTRQSPKKIAMLGAVP